MSALSYAALAVNHDGSPGPSWASCWVTIGGVNGGLPALNFTSFSMEEGFDVASLFDGNSLDPSTVWLGSYSGTQLVNRMIVGTSGTHFLFLPVRARGCISFALLSSHFQVKPTHSLHTPTDKLSRHAYTLPCPMGGGSYDAVDTIDVQALCWVATRQCGGYSR